MFKRSLTNWEARIFELKSEAFVQDAQEIAAEHAVNWSVRLDPDGTAVGGTAWNLTEMVHVSPPPTYWLRDLGTDRRTVEELTSSPPPGPQRIYRKKQLSPYWQDLIKACVIDQLFVRRNSCVHILGNVVRPLRVLATCAQKPEPWKISVDDVAFAIQTARKVQASGKLADLIYGVVISILDPNHLTDNCPLSPALTRDKIKHGRRSRFTKSVEELRSDLEERKHAEKLPERRAFWELVRIAFTETPRSFLDLLRFAQTQTFVMTGLREGEGALLPADWKRYREYIDVSGKPAADAGGISRSLILRHFAEKQRVIYKDSTALFETAQHVPLIFEENLTKTLDQVVFATEPLRRTLRRQIETGRALPDFEAGNLVRAIELYTYLTGNPFIAETPQSEKQRYIDIYHRDFNPEIFEQLRQEQLQRIGNCNLEMATYVYFNRFNGAPYRRADGTPWEGRKSWESIYLRIAEVEEYLARELPTKRSYVIENYRSIQPEWLQDVTTIGLTAGASAPEILVQEVLDFLAQKGFTDKSELEVMPEHIRFGLDPNVVRTIASAPAGVTAEHRDQEESFLPADEFAGPRTYDVH